MRCVKQKAKGLGLTVLQDKNDEMCRKYILSKEFFGYFKAAMHS